MQQKRVRDQRVIEKHRKFKQQNSLQTPATDDATVSSSIACQGLSAKADAENFISYFPKDHHSESG